jgi:hypothetical protein
MVILCFSIFNAPCAGAVGQQDGDVCALSLTMDGMRPAMAAGFNSSE